ncbi:polysaccharide biosynthesis protein [Stella sp.]|uniref:polysaccharide biosynthesis protein n=1 Tax=Stella sp. TaxID=2912054 RepID=UPI0035AEB524
MTEVAADGALAGKRVLVTGGTGSLGQALVRRLLSGAAGPVERVVVLSRDEAKQHDMRIALRHLAAATDEVIYGDFRRRLQFRIGDVRDPDAVAAALDGIDVVVHAAAMKQVPTCEYFPHEAVRTNVEGAHVLMTALQRSRRPVEAVVGVSTDKAVEPVNAMGMSKALQERVMIAAQLALPATRVALVRYGNVLASRGSVVPLFRRQILAGGPVTVTDPAMTRFLLPMAAAVDAVLLALSCCGAGEILVPRIASARIADVARAMIGDRPVATVTTGIRPGEKLHETLISAEESPRARDCGDHWRIRPMLPELAASGSVPDPVWAYHSASRPLDADAVRALLAGHDLLPERPAAGPR